MVRSAAALVAVLVLPSFALGQEPMGTHTVVDRDTLWDLAQRYYQNPFEWRVIWNANREVVEDPNLIYPDEVLQIPGLPGVAGGPVVLGPEPVRVDEPPEPIEDTGVELVQFGFRQARPAEQVRTIFHNDTASIRAGAISARDVAYVAVTRDAVYSAPWLVRLGEEPEVAGTLGGFATLGDEASTIRSFDRVLVDMPAPARVGEELQIFRVMRSIETVGQVAIPTGMLTVLSIGGGGVIGVVTKEYQRIQAGDFVRPAPTYALRPGQYARAISGGSEAMVMGFAGRQVLNDLGHVAFLDLGSDDGVTIGDEFVLYGSADGSADGSLQVVGVTDNMASARIQSLRDNVFRQGVVVRLARKMP